MHFVRLSGIVGVSMLNFIIFIFFVFPKWAFIPRFTVFYSVPAAFVTHGLS
jgi:hypothetical protein